MNPIMWIIALICAVIAGAIASSKGRSVVGWSICGFLIGLIGVIIIACQSNLKEQKAQVQRAERERRRLREQLRQERQKTETFRQHAVARLDAHDNHLGVDTRSTRALPGDSQDPLRALANANTQAHSPEALPAGPTNSLIGTLWYYASGSQAQGPVSEMEMHHLINSSTINSATMVWTEGYADWVRVDEVSAFGAG